MPDQPTFAPTQWALVKRAPLLVFYFVAKADENVDACEIEQLIRLFQKPDEYGSDLYSRAVAESMSDPTTLATVVEELINDDRQNVAIQFHELQEILDANLPNSEANAYRDALARLGMDIATATGEVELPVSKDEWAVLQSLKQMLGI